MNFTEIVMLRGLLEKTCDAWWNTDVEGIVKLCTCGAGESDRGHVAEVAADVLRVVEDVEEAAGELELVLFR